MKFFDEDLYVNSILGKKDNPLSNHLFVPNIFAVLCSIGINISFPL